MNEQLFEQLLFEEEGPTLDFKRDQYAFAKATDDDKSELLKDILGFANAWRRAEAYILIGVEDVRGGRGNVIGIPEGSQLDDHSLQQFVNNLTNRPVQFHYEAFGFDGKQIGIIRIDERQARPIYLKRDFGKLKKSEVYVRRGSSTDPSKPAAPDEIAQMGGALAGESNTPKLSVQFAAIDRLEALGETIEWSAELCEMPSAKKIPMLDDTPPPIALPGGRTIQIPSVSSFSPHDRLNSYFYHECAGHVVFHKLCRQMRLVVANTGQVAATDVRIELVFANGQGYGIIDLEEAPARPTRRKNLLEMPAMKNLRFRSSNAKPGEVDIDRGKDQTKVEIDCGGIQPGRKVWTSLFYVGIGKSSAVKLTGHLFASNLPQPQEFLLTLNATISESRMSVDELLSFADREDRDDGED